MAIETNKIVYAFVAVLIGIVLIPVVNQVAVDANLSGSLATIVALIPLLFALGVLVVTIKHML